MAMMKKPPVAKGASRETRSDSAWEKSSLDRKLDRKLKLKEGGKADEKADAKARRELKAGKSPKAILKGAKPR